MAKDLYLILQYRIKPEEARIVDTNIKNEHIKEILSDYVQAQIGKGEDFSKSEKREEYTIRIDCDLSDDTFYTRSNTGRKGLTLGIVMRSLEILVLDRECTKKENGKTN
jgi:hypothetical protein